MDHSPLHTNDASGPVVSTTDGVVHRFEVDRAGTPTAPAILRYHATEHDRGLRCTAGALRHALARCPGATVVLLAPDDAAVAPWLAVTMRDDVEAVVTARTVTDAVKRVADGTVVATVDRRELRWVSGPALVRRSVLARVVEHATDDTVVEPLAAVTIAEVGA
jgi:hypothetical protein